jgi:hypothetical protein
MSQLPSNIVDGGNGELLVRASLIKVVHGHIQLNNEREQPRSERASLIVAEFKFISKNSLPIVSAIVGFSFAGLTSIEGPTVHDIAPRGSFSIEPTENQATTIIGPLPRISSKVEDVQMGKPQRKDSWDSKPTSAGRIRIGRSHKKDTARWDLEDNTQRTGIPQCFRTVIVLRRTDDEPFLATVEVKASISKGSSFFNTVSAGSFGQTITNDPMVFTPTSPPPKDLDGIDLENLDKSDMRKLSQVAGTEILFPYRERGFNASPLGPQDRSLARRSVEVDDFASLRSFRS